MKQRNSKQAKSGDALRVLLALVFILGASIASRDHQTPEKTLEAAETKRAHAHEEKTSEKRKLSEIPLLSRINGSI